MIDAGKPRNRFAKQAHNALTVEGKPPAEIQKLALSQVKLYDDYLDLMNDEVIEVKKEDGKFNIRTKSSAQSKASRIIFATGGMDELPSIKGLAEQ